MDLLEELQKIVGETPILNIYTYGSINYGTIHKDSDRDYILIVDMKDEAKDISYSDEKTKIDLQMYNKDTFQKYLDEHKMALIEAIHHPVLEKVKVELKLDLQQLRHAVSELASHCYVKAKKKVIVEKDKDYYIAKKSLFHGFRIINYAIQLAKDKKISNWNMVDLYKEIMALPEESEGTNASAVWEKWNTIYKQRFNKQMTEFRLLAPK